MTKKEMEYEDSPSGYVTLYNYKEPFMRFEEGYGYLGVLLFDGKTDKVQCHMCGDWFEYLPNHLHKEHNMRAREYKEKVGLRQSTALLNEKQRAKLIENGLENRMKNLRPGVAKTDEEKKKISRTLRRSSMEHKNECGTCPLQILDQLVKQHDKLGRVPTRKEFKSYKALIEVYGTMGRACQIAGLERRKPGVNVGSYKYDSNYLLTAIQDFAEKHKRKPSSSDCRRGLLPNHEHYKKHFGSWKNALNTALTV
jgi:hypothetical protein